MLNFYSQIFQAKENPASAKLSLLLNEDELSEIYNFLLFGANLYHLKDIPLKEKMELLEERYRVEYKKIKIMEHFARKIRELGPDKAALHLAKEDTGLKHTLEIIFCKMNGFFMLNVLTNSKLEGHTPENPRKRQLARMNGTYKYGKAGAWQLVPIQKPLFKRVVKKEKHFEMAYEEAELSQVLDSDYIMRSYAGEEYTKNGIKKLCLYSDYAKNGDLFDFKKMLRQNKKDFSLKQKNIYILNILLGLKKLHDAQRKHGDLKLENVLILGNHCALTDLDFATSSMRTKLYGTFHYWSVEMCYFCSKTKTPQSTKMQTDYFKFPAELSLGKSILLAPTHFGPPISQLLGNPEKYRCPTKESDIWAFGILAFEILFGRTPELSDQHLIDEIPILKGALNINPRARLKVDKLIKKHLQTTGLALPPAEWALEPAIMHIASPRSEQKGPVFGLGAYQTKVVRAKKPTSPVADPEAALAALDQLLGSDKIAAQSLRQCTRKFKTVRI